jgi:hypothetical protein
VCLTNEADTVIIPCGHLSTCQSVSPPIASKLSFASTHFLVLLDLVVYGTQF